MYNGSCHQRNDFLDFSNVGSRLGVAVSFIYHRSGSRLGYRGDFAVSLEDCYEILLWDRKIKGRDAN